MNILDNNVESNSNDIDSDNCITQVIKKHH